MDSIRYPAQVFAYLLDELDTLFAAHAVARSAETKAQLDLVVETFICLLRHERSGGARERLAKALTETGAASERDDSRAPLAALIDALKLGETRKHAVVVVRALAQCATAYGTPHGLVCSASASIVEALGAVGARFGGDAKFTAINDDALCALYAVRRALFLLALPSFSLSLSRSPFLPSLSLSFPRSFPRSFSLSLSLSLFLHRSLSLPPPLSLSSFPLSFSLLPSLFLFCE